jgi:molybdate transport system ATP-binding protein
MLALTVSHKLGKFGLNLSLNVEQELVALFGPSGAGKSMTLQMVAGLVAPDEGRISINGRVVFDTEQQINLPPQQRRAGYVMQDYTLFPHLSVAQNISYGLRRNGSKRQIQRAVDEMLELIQLPGFANHRPDELSGGQQQRVALARALVTNPDVLLLDEPFSALDGPTRIQLRSDVRQILEQISIPTLLVTHDLAEANLLAERIAVFNKGEILQLAPPAEIMRRPATLEVAQLTGTQNCFTGMVQAMTNRGGQVMVGALLLNTPSYPFVVGELVQCCIRPEHVLLLRSNQNLSRYTNVVQGEIISIVTDGLSYTLQLCLVDERLGTDKSFDVVVTLPLHVYDSLTPTVGEIWHVSLKQKSIHLLKSSQ